jgi:signal peptidase I
MESSSSHSNGTESPSERTIELIKAVLESGNSVELPASGYSMFPTLRPGDKVLISPVTENIPPVPGDILIIKDDNILVLHRLIEIRKDIEGNIVFITRGDSMNESDSPARGDQIVGIVYSFRRNNKRRSLRCRNPTKHGYNLNRVRLWIWGKVKRLKG